MLLKEEKMKFLFKPAYWLGGLAMALPLLFLILAIPFVNKVALGIVFVISQLSYLEAIRLIFKYNEEEIRELKEKLKIK
jgi:hypothetical protein